MSVFVTFHGRKEEKQPVISREQGVLMETSLLRGFQVEDMHRFSRVNDTLQPNYRTINRYTKSIAQYWKERNRRKQAWHLSGKGFTYKQIAAKLGVSEKTIQRDMHKISRYYIGQFHKACNEIDAERQRRITEKLEGLTLSQGFSLLTKLVIEQRKRQSAQEYKRHLIKIIIDMDDLKHGVIPNLKMWPRNVRSIVMPLHVQVLLRIEGKHFKYGGFTVGKVLGLGSEDKTCRSRE